MGNHYHLLVDALRAGLSDAMHRLNGTYAQAFNHRHGLDGHLFQDRFHSLPVVSDWHLFELLRYMALNPVRAGLCTFPADYRWSSFAATIGLARAPRFLAVKFVLAHFGSDPRQSREAFAAFVLEALPEAGRVAA